MSTIIDWLGRLNGPLVYAVVAVLVFCEDALFVGFVLPGETAVVVGGVIASQHRVSVWILAPVVVFAAIVGDSTGYEIGRRFGPDILNLRPLRRHQARVAGAQALIRRRGPEAVFLGRFIAFFRAMMPALAGISRLPYPRFLLFNALGGLVWGVGFTLLGFFAGTAYKQVEAAAGKVIAGVVAIVVLVGVAVWHFRKRRSEGRAERETKPGAVPEQPPAEQKPSPSDENKPTGNGS